MDNKKSIEKRSYADMRQSWGQDVLMPPVSMVAEEETEYRCPHNASCHSQVGCFGIATSTPLRDDEILNIKCRYSETGKMPVYAGTARVYR